MKPGIYSMEAGAYHAADGISRSDLEWIAAPRTPAHFRAWKDGLIPNETTDALTLGSITHRAILEPDTLDGSFVVKPDGMNFATKEGKAWKETSAGKLIVTAAQAEAISGMREAVWRHPAARALVNNSDKERSVFVFDEPLLLKSRFDLLPTTGNAIADLKTCASADLDSVEKAIWDYGYHRQAAFYSKVAKLAGIDREQFVFLFVEKTPPYCVAVYQLDPLVLRAGKTLIERDLALVCQCMETGEWPGYGNGVQLASVPPWAFKQIEAIT